MPVELEQPILDDGVKFVHFFEGRILSGQDLRDEQQAARRQRRRLGRAAGSGVAEGLEVSLVSPGGGGASPVVKVEPGWAVNREGEPLGLCQAENVELVRSVEANDGSEEIFQACADTPPGVQIPNGIGFYVLAIGPASGFQGEAPKSGLTNGGIAPGCGKRYATLGVRFRLIRLDPLALSGVADGIKAQIASLAVINTVRARSVLRNILAHVCLGTPQTRNFPADPALFAGGEAVFLEYGAVDDLRKSGALTECEVPLALLSWTLTGVGFLDMWAVRRRIHGKPLDGVWPLLAASRRRAEAEAASFQFQRQLSSLIGSGSGVFQTREYFRYLPAAGLVPLLSIVHPGFHPNAFFQGLHTSGPHPLEGARLLPLLDQSYSHRAIDLQAPEGEPGLIWRYTVRENQQAPTQTQRYQVFASGHLPFQGDPLFELKVTAKCAAIEETIEELREALAGQQTATLRVRVTDVNGRVVVGVSVHIEHQVTQTTRTSITDAEGLAEFREIPAGQWRITVSAPGFPRVAQQAVAPPGGTATVNVTLGALSVTGGGIAGVLTDETGAPLTGQIVEIAHEATGRTWAVPAGDDGSYSVDGLPPGSYRIAARPIGGGTPIEIQEAVEVRAGSKHFILGALGG